MKLLRETIRKLILEDACQGINKKVYGGILELEKQGLHITSAHNPKEYDSGIAKRIGLFVYDEMGKQRGAWMGSSKYGGDECLGAFQCAYTSTSDLKGTGVGALLYDVACELTGEKGISSDRDEVSKSAWKMWRYMTLNDQTYDIEGTYDYDGEQTPDNPMDDCMSISWEEYTDQWRDPNNHPLNHVFVKKDKSRPTIRCLEQRGLIKYDKQLRR